MATTDKSGQPDYAIALAVLGGLDGLALRQLGHLGVEAKLKPCNPGAMEFPLVGNHLSMTFELSLATGSSAHAASIYYPDRKSRGPPPGGSR
jgi:hypothetical protein